MRRQLHSYLIRLNSSRDPGVSSDAPLVVISQGCGCGSQCCGFTPDITLFAISVAKLRLEHSSSLYILRRCLVSFIVVVHAAVSSL